MSKQLIKKVVITLMVLFALFNVAILSSCQMEEANLDSMKLIEGAPDDFVIGHLDMSKYSFLITYKDGSTKTVQLTEDMISSEDYLKTFREGTHTITVNYLNIHCDITLTAKTYEFTNVYMNNIEVVYDGEAHGLKVEGNIPEGTTINFPSGNSFYDAGTYPIKAVLVNPYYATKTLDAKLVINKAVFDTSNIHFESATFDYDGNPKSIAISGEIPDFVKVSYYIGKAETNSMTEANENGYKVTAQITAGDNYVFANGDQYLSYYNMEATLTINKAVYDMSKIAFNSNSFVYDGTFKSLKVSNTQYLPKGVTIVYKNNDQKNVNEEGYKVIAQFAGDLINYQPIPDMEATLTITKADVNLSGLMFESDSFEYNQLPHFVYYTGSLPNGVSFKRYEYYLLNDEGLEIKKVDAMIEVGNYHAKAIFNYKDKENYNEPSPLVCNVEITKADITNAVFDSVTYNYDGFSHSIYVTNLPDGVEVNYTNNAQKEVGIYTISAKFSFIPGSVADRNYNLPNMMTATMSIVKANLGNQLSDTSVEYAGNNYNYLVSDYYGNNNTYLGKKIELVCGSETIEGAEVYEYIPSGVNICYTYYNTNTGNESAFLGQTIPGQVFIYANYYTESLSVAEECYLHYQTESPKLSTLNVNGEELSVYVLAKKYLMFTVVKRQYHPTFVNQLSVYTGSEISVLIDTAANIANTELYPNLSFANAEGGIYTDNKQTNPGIYAGSVVVQLSEDALQYYEDPGTIEFKYAIRGANGQTVYNPGVNEVVYDTYDESIDIYKINYDLEVPAGMTVNFVYNSDIVKPGSYPVKISVSFEKDNDPNTLCDGEIAQYYYRLPSSYISSPDGTYNTIITYTVEKKLYTPTFKAEYYYNGDAYLPEAVDLPTWLDVVYYENNVEVKKQKVEDADYVICTPDTYHLVAKLQVLDSKKLDYYEIDENGTPVDMIIYKGYFSDYKIYGETVKYDGKLHNITVTDLPDGITYSTSLGEGRSEVGVYKDVIIYFNNNSAYYNDLDNVKLTMTIEKNVVDMANIEAFVKTSGNKSVKQFSSLMDILGSYVDLTGATVQWQVDYYDNYNVIYPDSDTKRHGTSEILNDFSFVESTPNNEFAFVSFSIQLKSGYVFNDGKEGTTFGGSFSLSVSQSQKVYIDELDKLNGTTIEVAQGTKLNDLIESYLPKDIIEYYQFNNWNCTYYNLMIQYPADHTLAHCNNDNYGTLTGELDYKFQLNTWGERYCLVNYTISLNDDYCFTVGDTSYQTYTGSFKVQVTKDIQVVDDYFIQKEISNNSFNVQKYYYFDQYLATLIDTKHIDYTVQFFDNTNTLIPSTNGNYQFNDNTQNVKVDLNITLKGTAQSLMSNNTNSITLNKANAIFDDNVVMISPYVAMQIPISLSNAGTFKIEQYVQPGKNQVASNPLMQQLIENTNFSYLVSYQDGTTLYGINDSVIHIAKLTEEGEYATVVWTFYAKDGYGLYDENSLRVEYVSFPLKFQVTPVTVVSTEEFSKLSNETQEIDQYQNINETIQKYIDEVIAVAGNKLSYTWSGAYYENENKLNAGVEIDNSSDPINAYLDLSTSNNTYFNLMITLKFSDNDGFIFDVIEKEFTFSIRYQVKKVTVFEEPKLQSINNTTVNTYNGSSLQSIVNGFAFNTNLVFDSWSYQYNNGTEVSNNGTSIQMCLLNEITDYTVTLTFKALDGTCILDEGKGITSFSITITIHVIQLTKSTFNVSNPVYKNNTIYLGSFNPQRLENVNSYILSYLNNQDALTGTIMYKFDDAAYLTLDNSTKFETAGTYTYVFLIQTNKSTNANVYQLVDANGEILASYSDDANITEGQILVSMDFEVDDFEVLDTTTYNARFSQYRMREDVAPYLYFTDGFDNKCTVENLKVGENKVLVDAYSASAFVPYRKMTLAMEYDLVAVRGYAFDENGSARKHFSVTTVIKDSGSTYTLEGLLNAYNNEKANLIYNYREDLFFADKTKNYFVGPNDTNMTTEWKYKVYSTDGTFIGENNTYSSTIDMSDSNLNTDNIYVQVFYKITFKTNLYKSDSIWLKKTFESYYVVCPKNTALGECINNHVTSTFIGSSQDHTNTAYSKFGYMNYGIKAYEFYPEVTTTTTVSSNGVTVYSTIHHMTTDYGKTSETVFQCYGNYRSSNNTFVAMTNFTFINDFVVGSSLLNTNASNYNNFYELYYCYKPNPQINRYDYWSYPMVMFAF